MASTIVSAASRIPDVSSKMIHHRVIIGRVVARNIADLAINQLALVAENEKCY